MLGFDLPALLAFIGVLALQIGTPGPGKVLVVTRTLDHGRLSGALLALGLMAGDAILLGAALTGLSTATQALEPFSGVLKVAGAAVLLGLAVQAARESLRRSAPPPRAAPQARGSAIAGFLIGLVIPLTNPKALAAYLAITLTLFDIAALSLAGIGVLMALFALVFTLILGAHVWAAEQARRWLSAPGPRRVLAAANALVMAAVAMMLLIG